MGIINIFFAFYINGRIMSFSTDDKFGITIKPVGAIHKVFEENLRLAKRSSEGRRRRRPLPAIKLKPQYKARTATKPSPVGEGGN